MVEMLLKRFLQSLYVVVAMSLVVFIGVYAIGNPVELLVPEEMSDIERQKIVEHLGLDLPLYVQYFRFVGDVLSGDFGRSFVFNTPALALILSRLPATLELALASMLLATFLAIPLGLWAGLRPQSFSGRAIMVGSILGFSLPTFWVGLMMILVFSIWLGWLPSSGRMPGEFMGIETSFASLEGLSYLVLPAFNLALFKLALVIRLVRAGVVEAMSADYVRYAFSKGVRDRRVMLVHVLKNIMIPVVTVIGLELGTVIAFAVVTETIFAWPGTGKLIIDSIYQLDRPVIVAYLMIIVMLFVTINFIVDAIYMILDPRARAGGKA
jgi:peptide/nickel transport system permease protein